MSRRTGWWAEWGRRLRKTHTDIFSGSRKRGARGTKARAIRGRNASSGLWLIIYRWTQVDSMPQKRRRETASVYASSHRHLDVAPTRETRTSPWRLRSPQSHRASTSLYPAQVNPVCPEFLDHCWLTRILFKEIGLQCSKIHSRCPTMFWVRIRTTRARRLMRTAPMSP